MMPNPLPRLLALACLGVPLAAADYSDVQAIVATSCISCHGGPHAKGGLKLDTPENIMKGGKNGPAVVPGFPSDSPMYQRVILGADDSDVMPAKGDHLTDAQCATIQAWIKAGAPAGAGGDTTMGAAHAPAPAAAPSEPPAADPTMTGAAKPDPMKPDAPAMADPNAIMNPVVPPTSGTPGAAAVKTASAAPTTAKFVAPDTDLDALSLDIPVPEQKWLDALKSSNIWYRPLSKNGSLIELDCREITPPVAARLRGLTHLAANVAWLNLAGTAITNADLAQLKDFTHLQRLHLERTAIGDAGLATVGGFSGLTYLNLYGSKVTDAGLPALEPLTHLTELYLRGTAATPVGGDVLKKALPDLVITFDEDLPAPAAPGTGKKKGKGKKAN